MDPPSDDLEASVRALVEARRLVDPGDPVARLLASALEVAQPLRVVGPAEAQRRVDAAVRVLGLLAHEGADARGRARAAAAQEAARAEPPSDAHRPPPTHAHRSDIHDRPTPARGDPRRVGTRGEARPDAPPSRADPATARLEAPLAASPVAQALSELARVWAEQGRGTLPSEPVELLAELLSTDVPPGADAVRFHLALLRGVDQALSAARYLPCEPAILERAGPLQRAAAAAAVELGACVHPAPGRDPERGGPCPVQALPAFGEPRGALVWVDQHGFSLPDGRVEPALLRIACGPAPAWFAAAVEGYVALVRGARGMADGGAQVRLYRGWLEELPGADAERRGTTLRYAATALFSLSELDGAARATFARLCQALEEAGSFVIPLEARALADERRYELVLRPGAGAPRIVRPGFQGEGVVQQRARVLADPHWLGTMTS